MQVGHNLHSNCINSVKYSNCGARVEQQVQPLKLNIKSHNHNASPLTTAAIYELPKLIYLC